MSGSGRASDLNPAITAIDVRCQMSAARRAHEIVIEARCG